MNRDKCLAGQYVCATTDEFELKHLTASTSRLIDSTKQFCLSINSSLVATLMRAIVIARISSRPTPLATGRRSLRIWQDVDSVLIRFTGADA
jgi:hypothetical protein